MSQYKKFLEYLNTLIAQRTMGLKENSNLNLIINVVDFLHDAKRSINRLKNDKVGDSLFIFKFPQIWEFEWYIGYVREAKDLIEQQITSDINRISDYVHTRIDFLIYLIESRKENKDHKVKVVLHLQEQLKLKTVLHTIEIVLSGW